MSGFRSFTTAEQAAAYLRREMETGKLIGVMPGVLRLEAELGINRNTVETALRLLEKEGLLVPQGAGRRRKIVLSGEIKRTSAFRVSVLCYEQSDREGDYLLTHMISQLQQAGHDVRFASKTLLDLGMDAKRVARFAKNTDTDAWVVVAGSRRVLEWFAGQSIPAFALFGRASNVNLANAGASKEKARRELIDKFYDLGHRRIVMLVREERRKPSLAHL